ncbi:MAG: DUF4373 domain-containing protein, partial [Clostridia bacterium]|nr:DUF4373 domain-containing protein [Clostridia bacterium]
VYGDGYYTAFDEDMYYMTANEIGMNADKVREIITYMAERGLFDQHLLIDKNILTSIGVQRRYQKAVKARASKKSIIVNKEYWLLSEEETEEFIRFYEEPVHDKPLEKSCGGNTQHQEQQEVEAENSPDFYLSEKNPDKSEINDTKKSKVKKSKEKKSKVCVCEIPCIDGTLRIDENIYTQLTHTYPSADVKQSLKKLVSYLIAHPDKQRIKGASMGYLRLWLLEDDNRLRQARTLTSVGEYPATYDIDAYESYSVADTMEQAVP